MLSMVVFGTAWGFLTLIIYLIKGRHAKSKHCLDDDDDDVTEKHKTAGASMMSLKRKEQIGEPGSENIVAVIQLTTWNNGSNNGI